MMHDTYVWYMIYIYMMGGHMVNHWATSAAQEHVISERVMRDLFYTHNSLSMHTCHMSHMYI